MRAWLAVCAGAIVGAVVAVGLLLAAQAILPARYAATVLLFADDEQVATQVLRSELASTLHDRGFLSKVVDAESIAVPVAAELARSIRVEPAAESSMLTQLAAVGHHGEALSDAVDAVARALVDSRRRQVALAVAQKLELLDQKEAELEQDRMRARAEIGGAQLPSWARSASIALGMLDAERYGLQLRRQLGLANDVPVDTQDRRLQARSKQLEMSMGGTPPVTAQRLAASRLLASIDAKLAQVLAAREELVALKASDRNLRIVRGAETHSVAPSRRHIIFALLAGGLVGGLCMLLLRTGRPASGGERDGPMLESSLSIRVIGALPRAVSDYGERKRRPLAQTHPQHLAVDALRSVRTGLRVLSSDLAHPGPVVMANADDTHNAGHILANLAMLDAADGYRVLLVEMQHSGSVLSSLFTTGTRTTLSITMDAAQLEDAQSECRGNGRIRFVVADDDDLDGPPVPGAFIGYFDRVYIRADNVERAASLLEIYGSGIGVLVGTQQLSTRRWREARDRWRSGGETLHALIQCGHRIDERAYLAPANG